MFTIVKECKCLKNLEIVAKEIQLYKYYPNTITTAISGSSHCGKTNLVINLERGLNSAKYTRK